MSVPRLSEHDIRVDGIPVHCWEGGAGPDAVVLLHGSGAGASTLSNFRRVLAPLTEDFRVLAADLIGFGRSGLRPAEPYFDMNLWVRQLTALLEYVERDGVIVVGHSLSGSIALKAAGLDPRIGAVLATGTMGAIPGNADTALRWRFPESRTQLRQAVERTFFDPSLAEEAELDRREEILSRPGYREYFEHMFAGPAVGYVRAASLSPAELARIQCPVLFMHGLQDRSVTPQETSMALAAQLPHADVYVLSRCGHSVAHERPREFIAAMHMLRGRIAADFGKPQGAENSVR